VSTTQAQIVERAKVATSLVFVLAGGAFATWASRIPDVRIALDLTPGQLGLLLLCGSAGSLVGLPLAGWVASRIGTRNTVRLGATLTTSGLVGTGVAAGVLHDFWLTAAFLFVALAGIGQWDVAMNIEGAAVEHRLERNIMPRFHAAFSAGTVGMALIGAGLVAAHVPIAVHFAIAAVLLLGAAIVATRAFLPPEMDEALAGAGAAADEASAPVPTTAAAGTSATTATASAASDGHAPANSVATPVISARAAWLEPRTLLIGLVMLVAAFTEGTANDWISVAFVDGYDLPTWAGVLGFATFLSFMTIGRLIGASMLDRWGRVPVLRAMLIAAGFGSLMVVFGNPVLAYIGAAIWGFGVSLGFPVGISAASDDPRNAAVRVSVVSTIAYGAFLIGPPALGFLGDHWGILRALAVVSAMLILALLALPAVRKPEPQVARMTDAAEAATATLDSADNDRLRERT